MDLTNRQINIVNIVITHNKVSSSKIRTLLPEPLSIPTLNSELGKLVNHRVLCQTGKGRTKAYIISPDYK
jgi:predicted HTH transcriptional regulator